MSGFHSTGSLDGGRRRAAIDAIDGKVIDLLVVGAGATGTGTALDAAARGLDVVLIDKGDIASGTSSRSSQLVHGGLRYLQQGNIALVREALHERDLLLTTLAPGMVHPLRFLLPLRHRVWERAYLGTGLAVYDTLAGSSALPRHRHRSRTTSLELFPDLRPDRVIGAIEYHDAQMDDARLAVAIARTAVAHGAQIATRMSLVGSQGMGSDGIWRVSVRDEISGEEHTLSTRAIALCAGVWAPEVSALFTGANDAVGVARSKGVHLRLPRAAIDGDCALIVPTDRSVLFVLPSDDHWIVGTTDTPYDGDPDAVGPTPDDIDFLLGELAAVVKAPVSADDVTYAFAGLRPLARDHAVGGDTAKVSREHRIARVAPRVLSIVGGKWTTYRIMARDLVDTVLTECDLPPRPCPTATIPLIDTRAAEVAALMAEDPDRARPLPDAPGFTHADVVQAVVHEGAITVDDVVDRRLRLPLHLDRVTDEARVEIAEILAAGA